MSKTIYADEVNMILFFKPKEYLTKFTKGVLKQIRQCSFYVQRELRIHIPNSNEELLELIKQNPKIRTFFQIRFCFKNSIGYKWVRSRKEAVEIIRERESGEVDRIFIDEYKLMFLKRKEGVK